MLTYVDVFPSRISAFILQASAMGGATIFNIETGGRGGVMSDTFVGRAFILQTPVS